MHVTGAKRGKTRAVKTQLALVLIPIGYESGASFVNQSQSVVMQNQSKREITFDTQFKTSLISNERMSLQCLVILKERKELT